MIGRVNPAIQLAAVSSRLSSDHSRGVTGVRPQSCDGRSITGMTRAKPGAVGMWRSALTWL